MGIRLIDDQQIIDLTCLIADAFKDKKDKCGYPYIIHCLSVANYSADLAATYFGEQNTSIQRLAYIVGLCHDCYEDLPSESIIQVNDLIVKLFPDRALDIGHYINLLTRRHDQSNEDYLKQVTKSKIATVVKAADCFHNSLSERYGYLFKDMNSMEIDKVCGQCITYRARYDRLIELLQQSMTQPVFVEV